MANKVPAEKMRPLLERLYKLFKDALIRVVHRNGPDAMQRLMPLYEKMLSGKKQFTPSETPVSHKEDIKNLLEEKKPAKKKSTKTTTATVDGKTEQEAKKYKSAEEFLREKLGITINDAHLLLKETDNKIELSDIQVDDKGKGMGTK